MNIFRDISQAVLIKRNLCKRLNNALKGKRIVFNTVRIHPVPMHIELFLAHLLSRENAEVYILIDDGILRHWDSIRISHQRDPYDPWGKTRLQKFRHKFRLRLATLAYSNPNIKILNYSTIVKSGVTVEADAEDNRHAESSYIRYLENEILDSVCSGDQYYLDSVYNCNVSKAVGQYIVESINPDLFISSHGIYSAWGPCYDLVRQHNIPTMTYQVNGFTEKALRISDQPMQLQCYDSEWQSFKNSELTARQHRDISVYLEKRRKRDTKDIKVYFGTYNGFKQLYIPESDTRIFGLFPNVIWDGNIRERNTIFSGLVDWIIKTINIFSEINDYLIIRFHPSEITNLKGTRPLESIVREMCPAVDDCENIRLISSSENINTYEVLEKMDIGLIYGGTLAQEMTYAGIPVISCSRSVYFNAGFTYEPRNIEEYRDMILNSERVVNEFQENWENIKEKLLKYAYWYFMKQNYRLPILDNQTTTRVRYAGLSQDDLNPARNPALDQTLDKIKSYIRR